MKLTKITAAAVTALAVLGSAGVSADTTGVVLTSGNDASIGQKFTTPTDTSKLAALKDIAAQANPSNGLALYRLYNPGNGEHFYTTSSYEAASLVLNSGWNYEGTLGVTATSGTAVSRLYNATAGVHYYTASEYEARQLIAAGWTDEGVAFIDAGSVEVFAAYNANSSQHNFTTFAAEQNSLLGAGWKNAGGLNDVAFHLNGLGTSFGGTTAGLTGDAITSNGTLLAPAAAAATATPSTSSINAGGYRG